MADNYFQMLWRQSPFFSKKMCLIVANLQSEHVNSLKRTKTCLSFSNMSLKCIVIVFQHVLNEIKLYHFCSKYENKQFLAFWKVISFSPRSIFDDLNDSYLLAIGCIAIKSPHVITTLSVIIFRHFVGQHKSSRSVYIARYGNMSASARFLARSRDIGY